MKAGFWAGAAAAALILGGCASKPAPEPRPQPPRPQPVPPPPPPPPSSSASQDWRDLPLTPGAWIYRSGGAGSEAVFGPPASEAAFIVRCDTARRQVVLSREGGGTQLSVRTSSFERTLSATSRTEPLAYLSATLPASDPLLDAMVFSRGRFTVSGPGLPMLVLPAWPEPARVIEDCRS